MAAKKKTAKKSGKSKEYEFVVAMLKRNPKVEFAAVRDSAQKKGMKIYPIVYGRAQAALGIVKSAKRGQGKAKREAARRSVGRRGPGRPSKVSSIHAGLDGVIAQIRETEKERDRALQTLAKIRDLIDAAM